MFGCKKKSQTDGKYICPEMKALNYDCPALKEAFESRCPLVEYGGTCQIVFDEKEQTRGTLIIGNSVHKVFLAEVKGDKIVSHGSRGSTFGIKRCWNVIEV